MTKCNDCNVETTSEWTCAHQIKANVGDLIEIKKSLHCHWAVFIGDGQVVHLEAVRENYGSFTLSSSSVMNEEGKAVKASLEEVAYECKCRVNNTFPEIKVAPKQPEEIRTYAIQQTEANRKFQTFTANSEHFATECRFGVPYSEQVEKAKQAALKAAELTIKYGQPLCSALVNSADKKLKK